MEKCILLLLNVSFKRYYKINYLLKMLKYFFLINNLLCTYNSLLVIIIINIVLIQNLKLLGNFCYYCVFSIKLIFY